MKASYRWLCALVPELSATPQEIAERLTRSGLEVENLIEFGAASKQVLVARVIAKEKHPTKSKLTLVTIDLGHEIKRIVCGAPNVPEPGMMVAFAPTGTTLPALGITLAPREIAGHMSEGMLCSESELGLISPGKKDESPGILVLAADTAKPGTPLSQAIPATHDWIFEIGVTPNRPDALGHIGIARDIAALFELPFAPPPAEAPSRVATHDSIQKHASVSIQDTERCPLYAAAMVVDVNIGPSPTWLRYRLESLDIRSISNVVDITNLILLEYGQPMHAFDFDRVRGGKIEVRRAHAAEKFTSLDGIDHTLSDDDLVICDAEGPVALAGVMGGANSEIRPTTKRILLECAYFSPRGIRRSSRRHAIHTESSHRFERGVDHGNIENVLAHAASLITQLGSGTAIPGSIVVGSGVPPTKPIQLRHQRMTTLLGAKVDWPHACSILNRLGFNVTLSTSHPDEAMVEPPTHRPDIHGEADLIEEVIRIHGLDVVKADLPSILPQVHQQEPMASIVRKAAIGLGLSEAVSYSFVSPKDLEHLKLPAAFTLKNPLTEDRSVLRTSLLPGLIEAAIRARHHGVHDFRLFSTGSVFLHATNGSSLPDERPEFTAILAGNRPGQLGQQQACNVYDAKGIALELIQKITHLAAEIVEFPAYARPAYLHPCAAGEVYLKGMPIGSIGQIHPEMLDAFDTKETFYLIEINLRRLGALGASPIRYVPIPTLPAATRDIALVVHNDVLAGNIQSEIQAVGGDICEKVELFDIYEGANLPKDHRSLAFHVVYRDPKTRTLPNEARTLTDEEVDRHHSAVVASVNAKFGAQLRS